MRARLFPTDDSAGSLPIVLDSYPMFLGVGEGDDLQISESASNAHRCQIQLERGTLVAIDLESVHGTWVNGESIERAPLMPGDKLQIAGHSLIVSYERLTAEPPPDVLYRSLVPEHAGGEVG